jgi:7,8-dihydropterin-6-yl-methyl-4-(beta-D-ribofuranosyl)aminobenzene 5'-phosphate synthase
MSAAWGARAPVASVAGFALLFGVSGIHTSTYAADPPGASGSEGIMSAVDSLRVTVVYDNYSNDPGLETAWGFAALLEYGGDVVLFDTGADAATLLANLRALSVDPGSIDVVVLSHAHADHTGGLEGLLRTGARPIVYLLPSFPPEFKGRIRDFTAVVEAVGNRTVSDRISTTGALDGGIPEQGLFVDAGPGLVVVTGCAHPGVTRLVSRATALTGRPVHLLLGGFHLRHSDGEEVRSVIAELRALGVERLAPCHCTGDSAIEMFAVEYGESFVRAGVGLVMTVVGTAAPRPAPAGPGTRAP